MKISLIEKGMNIVFSISRRVVGDIKRNLIFLKIIRNINWTQRYKSPSNSNTEYNFMRIYINDRNSNHFIVKVRIKSEIIETESAILTATPVCLQITYIYIHQFIQITTIHTIFALKCYYPSRV